MEKELKELAKAGTGYVRAKTTEVWLNVGLTVILVILMGMLFSGLKFLLK